MAPTKTPEELADDENLTVSVTFRLNQSYGARLRQLAERVGKGHSTFARLIVQAYLDEHAPLGGGRKRK